MRHAMLTCLILSLSPPLLAAETFPPDKTLDEAVTQFMKQINCSAATLAVSRDGKLLYARGYGTMDKNRRRPTEADTLMRIASVSKPFTAATIKTLIREKKLSMDTKAFELLKMTPATKGNVDPRLDEITIAQLLEHKGGWDRGTSFDPMFEVPRIEQDLRLRRPAEPLDVVRWMVTKPLQFAPGEKSVYSNFGYCVLGRVIERTTHKSYFEAVQELVLKPADVTDVKLGHNSSAQRDPREVYYPVADDAFSLDVMDAHGGLIASAPGLCEFMAHYWISGEPRKLGQRGQNWLFFGSLPGTTSMALQRPDGVNVAVLLNGRRDGKFDDDDGELKKSVDAAVTGFLAERK
jgi:N-acyl-D-amino-acid deacylase